MLKKEERKERRERRGLRDVNRGGLGPMWSWQIGSKA